MLLAYLGVDHDEIRYPANLAGVKEWHKIRDKMGLDFPNVWIKLYIYIFVEIFMAHHKNGENLYIFNEFLPLENFKLLNDKFVVGELIKRMASSF